MQKRHIVLATGLLFAAQTGIAAANLDSVLSWVQEKYDALVSSITAPSANSPVAEQDSVFPASADDEPYKISPVTAAYFDQIAATTGLTGASGNVFPPSADDEPYKISPVAAAYFDQIAATTELTGAPGNVFAESADDAPYQLLPATIAYFDQKEKEAMMASAATSSPAEPADDTANAASLNENVSADSSSQAVLAEEGTNR